MANLSTEQPVDRGKLAEHSRSKGGHSRLMEPHLSDISRVIQLAVSIVASILLQVAVIYVPSFARVFNVNALLASHWFYILLLSAVLVAVMKLLNKPLDRLGNEHS